MLGNTIGFLTHEVANKPRMRLHRPEWADDQFEIISYEEWLVFKAICLKIGIVLVDLDEHSYPLHLGRG